MNVHLEYNIVNIIPIYHEKEQRMLTYYPRYRIIDTENIMNGFVKKNHETTIYNKKFRYIKITMNHRFSTIDIEALYYYVLVEHSFDLEEPEHGFDVSFLDKLVEKNNYFIITTPVLKYKDDYYTISNNADCDIIKYEESELSNDDKIIDTMIDNGCYSMSDNLNILIAFFQNKYIDKDTLIHYTEIVRDKMMDYICDSVILYLMSSHKVKNIACDFYLIYLLQNIDDPSEDILKLYDTYIFNISEWMPSFLHNKILFLTKNSCSYPAKIQLKFPRKSIVDMHVIDFYGLFASIVNNRSLFDQWKMSYSSIIEESFAQVHYNKTYALSYVLIALCRLYTFGYENITIDNGKIMSIFYDIAMEYDLEPAIKYLIIVNETIPDQFLDFMYYMTSMNIYRKQLFLLNINNELIYKKYSLYELIPYLNKIKEEKLLRSMMFLHSRFLNETSSQSDYIVGCIMKDYIEKNKESVL